MSSRVFLCPKEGCHITQNEVNKVFDEQVALCARILQQKTKEYTGDDTDRLGAFKAAHREALKRGITNSVATCTLMIELGEEVHFCAGSEKNVKITTVEDIDIFKALLLAKRDAWLK